MNKGAGLAVGSPATTGRGSLGRGLRGALWRIVPMNRFFEPDDFRPFDFLTIQASPY